jgi:hypothetical protein
VRFLRFLLFFRRQRRNESSPIREEDAYAHSYGERTGEVLSVARVPGPEAEPEPAPEAEPEAESETEPEPEAEAEPEEPDPYRTSGLTDELLRRAFRTKLDARGKTHA